MKTAITSPYGTTGRENSGGFRPLLLPGWTLLFLASVLANDHSGLLKKRREVLE